jgi:exopolysaccharide production protein ExoY
MNTQKTPEDGGAKIRPGADATAFTADLLADTFEHNSVEGVGGPDGQSEAFGGRPTTTARDPSDANYRARSAAEHGHIPLSEYQWRGKISGLPYKRAYDIGLSVFGLVLTLPLICLVAFVLRYLLRRPVLIRRQAVGARGRLFDVLIFDTTEIPAGKGAASAVDDKEGARKFLAFLHKSSIASLPKLVNVLRGEMSIVGPRPVKPDELEVYGLDVIHYLRNRPGLTGLSQITLGRDAGTSKRNLLDRRYSLRRTFWMDAHISKRFVSRILSGEHFA